MPTRHRSRTSFNPEKFLAAEAKKQTSSPRAADAHALCGVIGLTENFKETLYRELQDERPELFTPNRDFQRYATACGVFESALARSLAQRKIKLTDAIVRALQLDILRLFLKRTFPGGLGGVIAAEKP